MGTYRADWEAYMCPIFAEGYVQLAIVNQVTNVMDTMSLAGTNLTGTFNSMVSFIIFELCINHIT